MNRLLILPALIFASCAPTVQQTPTYTDTRSYATTCAVALAEVARVAPSLRPASLGGGWPAYSVLASSASSVTVQSREGQFTATTTVACTETAGRATLVMSSTGQTDSATRAGHAAYLGALQLPQ